MRISDWSSDVGSSDSQPFGRALFEKLLDIDIAPAECGVRRLQFHQQLIPLVVVTALLPAVFGGKDLARHVRTRLEHALEIGRASGRERVFQYVSLSGVAV